jgi:hypothetical protein
VNSAVRRLAACHLRRSGTRVSCMGMGALLAWLWGCHNLVGWAYGASQCQVRSCTALWTRPAARDVRYPLVMPRRRFIRLLLAGLAALAIASALSACGGARVATSAGGSSGVADGGYSVLLVPETTAGWAGWCFVAVGVPGGGCGDGRQRAPVIEEHWNGGDQPQRTVGVAVTTDQVARVAIGEGRSGDVRLLGGAAVATRAEQGLPAGLRVVLARVDGSDLFGSGSGSPHFIPLSAGGSVIPQPVGETASQLMLPIPTREVTHPANPSGGICEIKLKTRSSDLSVSDGRVITEVHGYSGFVGTGFITCASASYELAGWPLQATVLLSAAHPGARPPSLMAMKPLRGHPGVFSVPDRGESTGPETEQYARRVPGAWLVVSRAKPAQRLALLERLRAVVHL